MFKYIIPLVLFVVVVVFLAVGLGLNPRLVPSPLIDKPAPEFALPAVEDPSQTVSRADLLGKISLVNVWASWCVSCRAEHPFLMELARSGQVAVYGLNYKDARGDALRWLAQYGDPYAASAFDADGRVGIEWGVYGTPETFLVDRKGIIRYKLVGPLTADIWREQILPIIKKIETEPT
jgi:cytochrome c biogenesis protein CcmG/thiol:disulfide interchange protein DsbE